MLSGIGVDDAVVMVDFMRHRHRPAAPGGARSAIVEAALLRVTPVLMTTVTTVLAAGPLPLTSAPAQELQRALALTLIGGLTASTLLSICFVPLLYEVLAPEPAGRPLDAEGADGLGGGPPGHRRDGLPRPRLTRSPRRYGMTGFAIVPSS